MFIFNNYALKLFLFDVFIKKRFIFHFGLVLIGKTNIDYADKALIGFYIARDVICFDLFFKEFTIWTKNKF